MEKRDCSHHPKQQVPHTRTKHGFQMTRLAFSPVVPLLPSSSLGQSVSSLISQISRVSSHPDHTVHALHQQIEQLPSGSSPASSAAPHAQHTRSQNKFRGLRQDKLQSVNKCNQLCEIVRQFEDTSVLTYQTTENGTAQLPLNNICTYNVQAPQPHFSGGSSAAGS